MSKATDKNMKKFSSRMQARLLLVFCVITVCLLALIGRLIYIMQTDGERYAKQVLSRQSYVSSVLPYRRGTIMDRNGTELARSELRYKLILDAKVLNDNTEYIPKTVEALAEHFAITSDQINQVLKEKAESRYAILQKGLEQDIVADFKKLIADSDEIKGIWFEEEFIRNYPFATLASDVIGFTSTDNTGYWGIEEYYNDILNGINGREYGYYDSTLNIERIVKKAVNGNSIVSTIDANAQRIIQKHIKSFNEEFGSKGIGILVLGANDGEIIAMASNEEYDLNNPRDLEPFIPASELAGMTQEEKMNALNALWRNDIISNSFEPGSTFKSIPVAASLEEALISDHTTFYCDGGEFVGGRWIRCSNRLGHGEITLAEALMKSCNDAMMQIAAAQGRNMFYQYQTSVGLGSRTGIDLPGEASGIIVDVSKLNSTELATSSFGQTFTSTMLQMATAYASMVNGGYLYQPHVVKQIVSDDGATVKKVDPILIKRTISEETSKLIQKYMYQTVEAGTAKPARVEGYAIGGKTGTAEKLPRGSKTYIVSFLGSVPAVNPEIIIYVMIDEAQNVPRQDNSSLATSLASRVMTELLPALGIYPEGEIDYLLPSEEESNPDSNHGTTGSSNNPSQDQSPSDTNPTDSNTGGDNNGDSNEDSSGDSNSSEDSNGEDDLPPPNPNAVVSDDDLAMPLITGDGSTASDLEDAFFGDNLPTDLDEVPLEENEANEPINE